MIPELVSLPAFKIAGLLLVSKNENNEIVSLWDKFMPYMEGNFRADLTTCYGLCLPAPDWAEEGAFEYIAGVEIKPIASTPAGLITRDVPAAKYAKFKHFGNASLVKETFDKIYGGWLKENGLTLAPNPFDMEVYDEGFKPGSPDSVMYVYVAVV